MHQADQIMLQTHQNLLCTQNKFLLMSMGLWKREYSEQIVPTRTVQNPYYSFVWGPLKHDQETACRWMKYSDVVPEAGCHYLFETPTAIYTQMAGWMPVIQWKYHSFHVLIMYFHHEMLEEVARSSWNDSSWEQATADRTAHPAHSPQVRANRAGDTTWDTPRHLILFNCLRNGFRRALPWKHIFS